MENVSVTVTILERSYKLTIAPQEETHLRDAAALIDAQAKMFKKQYGHRDNQDLLAMVALAQVTELMKTQDSLKYKDNELITKLTEIDSVLNDNLHPTQNSL
ncbi:MAG: cell division protein ZapA [Bacteroidales bacterium]|nr:cell division protein ZapA [Bacteroidales bacterium]